LSANSHPATWTRIAPGVYLDADGDGHLVVSELLRHAGYADTPENREAVTAAAQDLFPRAGVEVEVRPPGGIAGDVEGRGHRRARRGKGGRR